MEEEIDRRDPARASVRAGLYREFLSSDLPRTVFSRVKAGEHGYSAAGMMAMLRTEQEKHNPLKHQKRSSAAVRRQNLWRQILFRIPSGLSASLRASCRNADRGTGRMQKMSLIRELSEPVKSGSRLAMPSSPSAAPLLNSLPRRWPRSSWDSGGDAVKPEFSILKMTLVPHDMQCGYLRLSMLARDWPGIDVSSGKAAVIFISRNGGIAKLIWADDKGSNLLTRKLRSGYFQRLVPLKNAAPGQRLTKAELMAYLDGERIQRIRTGVCQSFWQFSCFDIRG